MQAIRRFDPDRAFLAFLNATNQKGITGEIFYTLIKALAGKGLILSGDSPVELYIPGIGDGFQAQEIAEAIYHVSGRKINIRGIDASDSFVNAATQRLMSNSYINQTEISIGDVFTCGSTAEKHSDITVASHLLYYAASQTAITNFMLNIANTFTDNGLAILIHNAPDSKIAELRSTYNPSFLAKPTLAIDMAARNIGLPVFKIDYTSSLAFLDTSLVKSLKAWQSYDEFESDDNFVQTANLIQFIFQRSLSTLERENLLGKAIDDVIERLDRGTNELEILSQFQIILSPTLVEKQAVKEQLHDSIALTISEIPQIQKRYPNPVVSSKVPQERETVKDL